MRLHPLLDRPGRQSKSVFFGCEHLDLLPTARDERGQRLRLFIGDRADGWTDGFGEPGEDLGIEPIRLRQLSRGPSKVPHLTYIDDHDRQSGGGQ